MDRVRAGGGTQAVDTKQLFQNLVKDTLEVFIELELEEHLGYPEHDPEGRGSGNSRNGGTAKTVRGDFGEVEIEVPRLEQESANQCSELQNAVERLGEGLDWPMAAKRDLATLRRDYAGNSQKAAALSRIISSYVAVRNGESKVTALNQAIEGRRGTSQRDPKRKTSSETKQDLYNALQQTRSLLR